MFTVEAEKRLDISEKQWLETCFQIDQEHTFRNEQQRFEMAHTSDLNII